MSQWTHVRGIIRIESFDFNKTPKSEDLLDGLLESMNVIQTIFSKNPPTGSEGPLQVSTILTWRGPTIVLTGDLRDFGKEDLDEVLEWLNDCTDTIYSGHSMWIRDAIVECDVEFDKDKYIFSYENKKFKLNQYKD